MDETRKKEVKRLVINIVFMIFTCVLSIQVLTFVSSFDQGALKLSKYEPQAGTTSFIPYDETIFKEAQNAGKPIVISVTAKWCGTCKAQKSAIEEILPDPYFENVVFMRVDYDRHKAAYRYFRKSYKVKSISTLLAFKGENLVAHSIGDTDHVKIVELFMKTVD